MSLRFCKVVAALLVLVFACVSCQTTGQTAGLGAVLGGVAGGLIGQKSGNAAQGALIGAALGGLAGYAIGKIKESKQLRTEAQVIEQDFGNEKPTAPIVQLKQATVETQPVQAGKEVDIAMNYNMINTVPEHNIKVYIIKDGNTVGTTNKMRPLKSNGQVATVVTYVIPRNVSGDCELVATVVGADQAGTPVSAQQKIPVTVQS